MSPKIIPTISNRINEVYYNCSKLIPIYKMEFSISASDFVFEQQGKLRDSYKVGKKLGEGAFSSVRALKHRVTGELRAVKTIHKKSLRTEEERGMFFNEVAILRQLDHPNIIRLYEFYQDDKNYYMITEYCNGGELFDKILTDGTLSEAQAADYMQQILSVVLYLHNKNIVHRDLKPENFLLSKTDSGILIKVIDFGSAQNFVAGEFMSNPTGTPFYIAPEVLRHHYTESCDVWSAGVVLYILLCGYPPFYGKTDPEVLEAVLASRLVFSSPDWDYISAEVKSLISSMLNPDLSARIDARTCLEHEWLRTASSEPLNQSLAVQLLNNLKSFRSAQLFQKATLSFIGSQLATNEEREEMVQLFKSLDTDNNGTLSREELKEGFNLLFVGEFQDIDAEVDRIMKEVDVDQSGSIDYSEFVTAAMNRQKMLSEERLLLAFKAFDIDGSGTITPDELRKILGKQHKQEETFWEGLIKEVDENGDGEIDFQEFVNMMSKAFN